MQLKFPIQNLQWTEEAEIRLREQSLNLIFCDSIMSGINSEQESYEGSKKEEERSPLAQPSKSTMSFSATVWNEKMARAQEEATTVLFWWQLQNVTNMRMFNPVYRLSFHLTSVVYCPNNMWDLWYMRHTTSCCNEREKSFLAQLSRSWILG